MLNSSLRSLQLRLPGRWSRASFSTGSGCSPSEGLLASTTASIPLGVVMRKGTWLSSSSRGMADTASCTGALRAQRRGLEYWGIGVTGRTQPYAQGDMLPRLDNMKQCVAKSSTTAAALTGNPNIMAYDSSTIFSVKDYSAYERDHYQPLRGITTHRVDALTPGYASTVSTLLQRLFAVPDGDHGINPSKPRANPDIPVRGLNLRELWWTRLLQDFPSLKTPATPAFRLEWEQFFIKAAEVSENAKTVQELSRPFILQQLEKHFINYAMIWRIAERLSDALAAMTRKAQHESIVTPQEHHMAKVVIERIIKLALDTLAAEPWAHQETSSPLHVEVSQFRAWHEAGNW